MNIRFLCYQQFAPATFSTYLLLYTYHVQPAYVPPWTVVPCWYFYYAYLPSSFLSTACPFHYILPLLNHSISSMPSIFPFLRRARLPVAHGFRFCHACAFKRSWPCADVSSSFCAPHGAFSSWSSSWFHAHRRRRSWSSHGHKRRRGGARALGEGGEQAVVRAAAARAALRPPVRLPRISRGATTARRHRRVIIFFLVHIRGVALHRPCRFGHRGAAFFFAAAASRAAPVGSPMSFICATVARHARPLDVRRLYRRRRWRGCIFSYIAHIFSHLLPGHIFLLLYLFSRATSRWTADRACSPRAFRLFLFSVIHIHISSIYRTISYSVDHHAFRFFFSLLFCCFLLLPFLFKLFLDKTFYYILSCRMTSSHLSFHFCRTTTIHTPSPFTRRRTPTCRGTCTFHLEIFLLIFSTRRLRCSSPSPAC